MAIKSKKVKTNARIRRKHRIRKSISSASVAVADARPRLTVYKSSKHTYAQVISDIEGKTIAAASTLDAEVVKLIESLVSSDDGKGKSASSKGTLAAQAVGSILADKCLAKKVAKVVFDRNGFIYHGRIKAVADGARQKGLEF